MPTSYEVEFDGQVFRPTAPISLPPNTTFRITVEPIGTGAIPVWVADARRALARVAELPDGWDGGRSPSPRRAAVAAASRVLDAIAAFAELPAPHVGPTVGGGIGIEWRNRMRDLDLEVLPDWTIEYLKSEKRDGRVEADGMDDGMIAVDEIGEVRSLVQWLIRGG